MSLTKSASAASKLARFGLRTDMDLVLHLPLRYEDETRLLSIKEARFHGTGAVQVEGIVSSCEIQTKPRRQLIVVLADDSEQLVLRFLNFYGSQVRQFSVGNRMRVRGEIRDGFFGLEMVHPAYQSVLEETPLPTTLTPVYPSGEKLTQNYLRKAIASTLERTALTDTLPDALLAQIGLPAFRDAILFLHRPPAETATQSLVDRSHPAWQRIKFDELLAQQISMRRAVAARHKNAAPALAVKGEISRAFHASLPFKLTDEQVRVLTEISADISGSTPMQRLLQGDVGSGKTIVAALAAAQAIDSGYQVALMAPTEILAEQHFQRIAERMMPLGVSIVWLSGQQKKREKTDTQKLIASGAAQLVIGTHALLQDTVQFAHLGLVIIDEQHRFGVGQRLSLRNKGENDTLPHQLMMSATPIPRTLAMTYYANLDVSVIQALPPGRTPVITRLVDRQRRDEVIARIHAAALAGKQAYWVCPLIEESEALQLQTATDTHAMLRDALPDLAIGLIHGRLKSEEKQTIMEDFALGRLHLLVTTTVIEVGVDVPNASLMIIEHAERFGLSQLHQLRGRVGRGSTASVCLLLYQSPLGATARERLMTMRETTDGFEIARRDLEIRGPGEFLGARQSGVPVLRFANLETDQELVECARNVANALLAHSSTENTAILDAHLSRWLGAKEDFMQV